MGNDLNVETFCLRILVILHTKPIVGGGKLCFALRIYLPLTIDADVRQIISSTSSDYYRIFLRYCLIRLQNALQGYARNFDYI